MYEQKIRHIGTILKDLSTLIDIPQGFEEKLIQVSRLVHQQRLMYIEYPGEVGDGSLWYLLRGVARSVVANKERGEFCTIHLWKKGDVILHTESLLGNADRDESIQLLDESILLQIPNNQVQQLLGEWPILYGLINRLAAYRRNSLMRYALSLRYPAIERIRLFLKNNPAMHRRVGQAYLADYLAMDRSTFSSLLKQIQTASG